MATGEDVGVGVPPGPCDGDGWIPGPAVAVGPGVDVGNNAGVDEGLNGVLPVVGTDKGGGCVAVGTGSGEGRLVAATKAAQPVPKTDARPNPSITARRAKSIMLDAR